ncbi:MAG: HAMP domain-containing protein [Caulobacteraceae bacterium]|nr:HAMP domain-containing protein [Caulobacter sp.]
MSRLRGLFGSLRLQMALLLIAGMGFAAVAGGWMVWVGANNGVVAAGGLRDGGELSPMRLWRHVPDYALLLLIVSIGLALVAVRYVTHPLARLADAARRFATSLSPHPVDLKAPTEFQPVLEAFEQMQRRVSEGVQERMHMLSAVNHDLRTPLSRLALRLDRVDDVDLRARLRADVAILEGMVARGMELARGVQTQEPVATIDLAALLQTVADEANEAAVSVVRDPAADGTVRAQPEVLYRCLTNLVDNAVRYGGGAVLSSEHRPGGVRILVADRGPGLPPEALETAFRPFTRLGQDGRQVDGSGLGLTIARQQARTLGGEVTLANRQGGGLIAAIDLPLQE